MTALGTESGGEALIAPAPAVPPQARRNGGLRWTGGGLRAGQLGNSIGLAQAWPGHRVSLAARPPTVRSFASDVKKIAVLPKQDLHLAETLTDYSSALYLEEVCSSVCINSTEGVIQEVNISITVQCSGELNPLLLASTQGHLGLCGH